MGCKYIKVRPNMTMNANLHPYYTFQSDFLEYCTLKIQRITGLRISSRSFWDLRKTRVSNLAINKTELP
jgi:hypothetical protein